MTETIPKPPSPSILLPEIFPLPEPEHRPSGWGNMTWKSKKSLELQSKVLPKWAENLFGILQKNEGKESPFGRFQTFNGLMSDAGCNRAGDFVARVECSGDSDLCVFLEIYEDKKIVARMSLKHIEAFEKGYKFWEMYGGGYYISTIDHLESTLVKYFEVEKLFSLKVKGEKMTEEDMKKWKEITKEQYSYNEDT